MNDEVSGDLDSVKLDSARLERATESMDRVRNQMSRTFIGQDDVIENVLSFKVNGQFLDVLPYILTVVILAGFVGKAIPPRAGGEPYVKER